MRVLAPEMFVMLNALTHIELYLDLFYFNFKQIQLIGFFGRQ